MKVETVGKILSESIERDRKQEALKKSVVDMTTQTEGSYDQKAINLAMKRGEIREKEIASRANRLKIYMDTQRKINNSI